MCGRRSDRSPSPRRLFLRSLMHGWPATGLLFEEFFEHKCIIVLNIMGAVHKRDPASPGPDQKWLPGIRMFLQFPGVPAAELLPFCRIMLKPAPQIVAGRNIFEPTFYLQVFFLYSARPESFDKESRAITWASCLVSSLDLNHLDSSSAFEILVLNHYRNLNDPISPQWEIHFR